MQNHLIDKGNKMKALVAGYVGGINVGDEAIVAAVAEKLKLSLGYDIVIASGQPEKSRIYMGDHFEYVAVEYPGRALTQSQQAELDSLLDEIDVVVFAGGGLLQDVHSTKLVEYCAYLASQAKLRQKRVFAFGLGAGPLTSKRGIEFARQFLDANDAVSFRDQYSLDYIAENVTDSTSHLRVTFDSILTSSISEKKAQKTDTPLIGICLRPWKGLDMEQISTLCQTLCKKGYELVFMPYEAKDVAIFEQLSSDSEIKISLSDESSFTSTLDTILRLDGLVSMRLHANLFAMLSGVPFVALAYDNKLRTVFSSFGLRDQVLELAANADEITQALNSADLASSKTIIDSASESVNNDVVHTVGTEGLPKKYSFTKSIKVRMFWAKHRVLMPVTIAIASRISPVVSAIVPTSLKTSLKRKMGIKW